MQSPSDRPRTYKTEGVVLRHASSGEADRLLTIYTLDYGVRVTTIKNHLAKYEDQLSIAGRGGTFRYNNADHSIETGLLVARNILGEEHDVEAVNIEQEYHEEKRVER